LARTARYSAQADRSEAADEDHHETRAHRRKDVKLLRSTALSTSAGKNENPRRANSHAYRSLEIIRQKPGITYENFLRAGGRRVDLAWDVENGYAEAR
jgi:hypothetical protein